MSDILHVSLYGGINETCVFTDGYFTVVVFSCACAIQGCIEREFSFFCFIEFYAWGDCKFYRSDVLIREVWRFLIWPAATWFRLLRGTQPAIGLFVDGLLFNYINSVREYLGF